MGNYVDRAKMLRPVIEQASTSLSDADAYGAPELFERWKEKGHEYSARDRVSFKGKLYKCLQDHTSQPDWTPDTAVSLWVAVADPSIEWPEWKQPAGAHDAYMKGNKVSHNDKHWISDIDANTYEPGVYGWTEA